MEQSIRIVDHDGEITTFTGNHFSLVRGPFGQRYVIDDRTPGAVRVAWTEPLARNLVTVEVTVTNPRPDFKLGGDVFAAVPEQGIPERYVPSSTRVIRTGE